jgi:peptidoglycan hydrolase-like protein with peptidoglycan-binding domain
MTKSSQSHTASDVLITKWWRDMFLAGTFTYAVKSPKKGQNQPARQAYAISWKIIMPNSLRFGDSGPKVKELQTLLDGYSKYINALAISPGAIDSQFGESTRLAVMAFQEQVFIPRTGIVADLTWRSLYNRAPVDLPELKFGESSDFVQLLEERLIRLRLLTGPADRKYEQKTLDVVQAFQRKASLPKRSTVDAAFWFALSKVPIV